MTIQKRPLLVVLAGNTLPGLKAAHGDFGEWIVRGLATNEPCLSVDAREVEVLPCPSSIAGVVVSGSHAMVTDKEDWSERLAAWLRHCVAMQIPVLGICYGHQLLAHALGGRVGYREQGMEIGTQTVTLTAAGVKDVLFAALPQRFPAQLVHQQSVLALPEGALLLASSAVEAHQAFRIGDCAWGVQFHPEFGTEMMRGYIRSGIAQPCEVDALDAAVQQTPDAAALLRAFGRFCAGASTPREGIAALAC